MNEETWGREVIFLSLFRSVIEFISHPLQYVPTNLSAGEIADRIDEVSYRIAPVRWLTTMMFKEHDIVEDHLRSKAKRPRKTSAQHAGKVSFAYADLVLHLIDLDPRFLQENLPSTSSMRNLNTPKDDGHTTMPLSTHLSAPRPVLASKPTTPLSRPLSAPRPVFATRPSSVNRAAPPNLTAPPGCVQSVQQAVYCGEAMSEVSSFVRPSLHLLTFMQAVDSLHTEVETYSNHMDQVSNISLLYKRILSLLFSPVCRP